MCICKYAIQRFEPEYDSQHDWADLAQLLDNQCSWTMPTGRRGVSLTFTRLCKAYYIATKYEHKNINNYILKKILRCQGNWIHFHYNGYRFFSSLMVSVWYTLYSQKNIRVSQQVCIVQKILTMQGAFFGRHNGNNLKQSCVLTNYREYHDEK